MLAKRYANCVYAQVCTYVKLKGEGKKSDQLTVIIQLAASFMLVLLLVRAMP